MIERIISVELIRNPYNWFVVFAMVAIAGLALHLIFSPPDTNNEGA